MPDTLMQVEPGLAILVLSILAGLQAWGLKTVADLRVQLAELNGDLAVLLQKVTDLDCQKKGTRESCPH